jgi:hypothetical protein
LLKIRDKRTAARGGSFTHLICKDFVISSLIERKIYLQVRTLPTMKANYLTVIFYWKKTTLIGIVQFFSMFCKPSQMSLNAASSLGKAARVFVIFRKLILSDSITLVV